MTVYGLLELLPTSRSAVGYWHNDKNYVVHAGQLPLVLFVFETRDYEESFLRAAGAHRLPICTSNLEMTADLGVLGEVWRWPPPNGPDRLPLHRLGEGYKNVPSRSRRFR